VSSQNGTHSDDISIERRGDQGGLQSIWIDGQPVGRMLEAQDKRIKELETLVSDLEDTVADLRQELADLEERADPAPDRKDYQEMSRAEKVAKLRRGLLDQAGDRGGRAAMQYREVLALFDNRPGRGTAYRLMEEAGEAAGFEYGRGPDGDLRVTVDVDSTDGTPTSAVPPRNNGRGRDGGDQ
jgi:hypothetical protein